MRFMSRPSGPHFQRVGSVRVEAPVVPGMRVIMTIGRRVDVDDAAVPDDPQHFQEGQPEHRVVLEARGRDDHVEMPVRERIFVRVGQHLIDAAAGFQVDADILDMGRTVGSQRSVDVERTDIQDAPRRCAVSLKQPGAEILCAGVHRLLYLERDDKRPTRVASSRGSDEATSLLGSLMRRSSTVRTIADGRRPGTARDRGTVRRGVPGAG